MAIVDEENDRVEEYLNHPASQFVHFCPLITLDSVAKQQKSQTQTKRKEVLKPNMGLYNEFTENGKKLHNFKGLLADTFQSIDNFSLGPNTVVLVV